MPKVSQVNAFVRRQKFEIRCQTSLNVCLHSILTVPNPILGLMFLSKFMLEVMKEKMWKFRILYPKSTDTELESVSVSMTRMLGVDGLNTSVAQEFVRILETKFSLPMNEIKDFNIILQGRCDWNSDENVVTVGSGQSKIWVAAVTVKNVNVLGYVVFDSKKIALYISDDSFIKWNKKSIVMAGPTVVVGKQRK